MSEYQKSSYRRYYDVTAWLLIIIIAADLAVITYRKFIPVDLKVDHAGRIDFPLQVDPNTAGFFDLQCLPGINKNLARAIIEYRTEYQKRFPGRTVFTRPEDLRRIKGVSERILSQFISRLTFPGAGTQSPPRSP